MSSVNMVILLGHLGADPEVRYTQSKTAVANFRIATSKKWKDNDGKPQERTEWHRVIAWNKLGELAGQYLAKGRQVHVVGELQTRKWTDKNGVEQYTTEIVASELTFVGGAKDAPSRRPAPQGDDFPPEPPAGEQRRSDSYAKNHGHEDDIPF